MKINNVKRYEEAEFAAISTISVPPCQGVEKRFTGNVVSHLQKLFIMGLYYLIFYASLRVSSRFTKIGGGF